MVAWLISSELALQIEAVCILLHAWLLDYLRLDLVRSDYLVWRSFLVVLLL